MVERSERQSAADGRRHRAARSARPPGRRANSPEHIPLAGWLQVFRRTWQESRADNLGLIAAGVAFFSFLALVPMLGAIVLAYGLVAEPETVVGDVRRLTAILPDDVARLIGRQLMDLVHSPEDRKGLGLIIAIAVALYGGSNGAGAFITALNVAYEEKEKRTSLHYCFLTIAITVLAICLALAALAATAGLAFLRQLIPQASPTLVTAGQIVAYLAMTLAAAAIASTLYRFGPSRDDARWEWLTPGSILTAVSSLALTLAFSFYVTHVAPYDAAYGTLGAVIALQTWLFLTAYVFIFSAELNRELEHQTARDTTIGAWQPLGQRGAWAADHVAGPKSNDEEEESEEVWRQQKPD